jgi:hypothetical protein
MATLNVKKGDYGYYLNFTVNDSGGDAYDLTDYTITLKSWSKSDPDTLLVEGECEAVIAASGICRYLVADGDFDDEGVYEAELELTKAGVVESTMTFALNVKRSG